MVRKLSFLTLIAWAAVAAAADMDLVIPAAGTGPGAGGSQWQTELVLHNAGADPLPIELAFYTEHGAAGSHSLTVAPRETVALRDAVSTVFGHSGVTTGAITIGTDNVALSRLAVASRTFNTTDEGEFGQDIPALPVTAALTPGDAGVIPGPTDGFAHRFNFGIFALEDAAIEWRLLRRNGSVAQSVRRDYQALTQEQYSSGVTTFFNVSPEDSDTIHARVLSGRAFVYGSWVHQRTGDPTYAPGVRVRENLPVQLLGVDYDENGTVDYPDADNDGVVDESVAIPGGRFGAFIRLVMRDPEGQPVTIALMNHPGDAVLMDEKGTVFMYPGMFPAGTPDLLIVRASDGIEEREFRIPLTYY